MYRYIISKDQRHYAYHGLGDYNQLN